MKHSRFVHLHLHTQYSLLDGAIRPKELFQRAHDLKMPAVAMTDHGNIFGAIDFYKLGRKSGVKPIIGAEVYVAPGARTDKSPITKGDPEVSNSFHLVLLVKNTKGYINLCKLLSRAYKEGFYYKPRVDKEILKEYNEGLIALSACLHGEISRKILAGNMDGAVECAKEYSEIFDNNRFYLEVQKNAIPEQDKVNKGMLEISKATGLPLVATNDCHYLNQEDHRFHDILVCVQTGKTVNDPNRMKFSGDSFYFKTPEEMIEDFKEFPGATENTVLIAERCNLELTFGEHHLPEFPLPEEETVESLFERETKEGLEKRLELILKDEKDESIKYAYYERLEKEIKVIKRMGFPGYFLIVADFIKYARDNDIPVGPGRGSAAGSLVAYALKITNLDPIKYNLLFERFLNPDRISLPDIDIDFCYEGRDRVIEYVSEKYGRDNVSQIITFGQMKAKAVIRDVGRVLEIPYGEVDKIAKLVPNRLDITIEKALKEEKRFKALIDEDERFKELIEAAIALEGLPRHASTHAAGLVIANKPLDEYLPLFVGGKDNVVTTQFPMSDVEEIGLVKFDFLGLKNITVIDRAVKEIKRGRGVDIDIDTLSVVDKKTYELVASGNTNGIFQLESSGMKELLKKLKPESFEDMIAAVALYRPGPLQSGMVDDYIKGKHGLKKISFEVPELKDILENTYGVMVYQEQVMNIARVLAGYTPGDADVLRKAMGKKVPEVMMEQRSKFLTGAEKKKIPKKKAEKIFDLMEHFAGYGFNKSHSAAYALIAYQTAYLKTHYPTEFMAALLSSNMGDADKIMKYIGDCRLSGIEVLPPDINTSAINFTVHGSDIRFGLAAVKNVGTAAIENILSARDSGDHFTSLQDFLARIDSRKVNKKVIESLIKCGALDSLGEDSRAFMFDSLSGEMELAQGAQRDREIGQSSLFDTSSPAMGSSLPGNGNGNGGAVPEWDERELLSFEKETLGFYISSHPLLSYEHEIKTFSNVTTESLKERRQGDEVALACVVTEKRETMTKKGARMAFMRVEDTFGGVEVVVFSDLYTKHIEELSSELPLLLTAKVEKDSQGGRGEGDFAEAEAVKLIALDVMYLSDASKNKIRKTHIEANENVLGIEVFNAIKDIITDNPGPSPIFLHILFDDGREVVQGFSEELTVEPSIEVVDKLKDLIKGAEIRFT